ncbi:MULTISPECIES: DUF3389 domain-containing protein [unclassified Vibrio]|uniref:DUF3389 domain-containing protein n=1 Tax=Vibrio TaxID=662 RepID=UPI0025559A67|nr:MULTISPECIES: DUF3389 domain-containing protein [unclassified Vibrio]MDK9775811.1 DUF3389 family protein [Vibrio sp. D401a]MDK9802888.1 DUF3389 domain-containing protein [Vibrio sp. D406a]CAH1560189.1 Phosphotransferase system IIA component [Vibrio rotiferianus]CAH1561992.1 Phosphotransferase system IIA component [Vibrio rotiferianus]
MVIEFSLGKIIATQREIVIKLSGNGMVTMQAQTDAIQLLGRGANVVLANGAESKWSIKLDAEDQLRQLAQEIGIDIQ